MKYVMRNWLLFVGLLCFAWSMEISAQSGACEIKRQEILKEIAYAEKHGNSQKASGLKTALRQVEMHCTDEGVLQSKQDKVAKEKERVAKREAELNNAEMKLKEAEASGNSRKIKTLKKKARKSKKKLAEAKESLMSAEKELQQ